MRKVFYPITILALLFSLFLPTSVSAAFAEETGGVDPDDIDRVVFDIEYINTDEDETSVFDRDSYYDAHKDDIHEVIVPYGIQVNIMARLDDNDAENDTSLYDDVYLYSQWYYRENEDTSWKAMEKKTALTKISQIVSQVNESGFYRLSVTAVQYMGKKISVSFQAETSVLINPCTLTVTYQDFHPVYNGNQQEIPYTIEGVLNDDDALCFPVYDNSPTDAGTYTVYMKAYNENYTFDEDTTKQYTIAKAPLTVSVEDVITPADTYYAIKILYSGFCGQDNEESLEYVPYMDDGCYSYFSVGSYEIKATGPATDNNYEIEYVSGYVKVSPSTLSGSKAVGFTGKAEGFFSPESSITVRQENPPVNMSVIDSYAVTLSGESYNDSYTLTMKDIDLTNVKILNVCYIAKDGTKQKLEKYTYDREKQVLTVTLKTPADGKAQTDGYIVVYHNWWWIIIPSAVLVVVILAVIIFHKKDHDKFKLAHLIYGSAKFEADKYRKMIGEVVEEDESHIDYPY